MITTITAATHSPSGQVYAVAFLPNGRIVEAAGPLRSDDVTTWDSLYNMIANADDPEATGRWLSGQAHTLDCEICVDMADMVTTHDEIGAAVTTMWWHDTPNCRQVCVCGDCSVLWSWDDPSCPRCDKRCSNCGSDAWTCPTCQTFHCACSDKHPDDVCPCPDRQCAGCGRRTSQWLFVGDGSSDVGCLDGHYGDLSSSCTRCCWDRLRKFGRFYWSYTTPRRDPCGTCGAVHYVLYRVGRGFIPVSWVRSGDRCACGSALALSPGGLWARVDSSVRVDTGSSADSCPGLCGEKMVGDQAERETISFDPRLEWDVVYRRRFLSRRRLAEFHSRCGRYIVRHRRVDRYRSRWVIVDRERRREIGLQSWASPEAAIEWLERIGR